jgi:hypothetical protein
MSLSASHTGISHAMRAPLAARCPRCHYLPASATVICPFCGDDRRGGDFSTRKENSVSVPSKATAALLAVSLLVLFLAACASVQPASDVPENLKPAANESLATIAAAKGVQIYECRASKDRPGEYDWMFVAPEAELFDAGGTKKIGKHYAGPHWELADGSRVVGYSVKERADAPRDGSIPWLLLAAKSDGPEGSFSKVTSVQRLHTVGGAAPKGGCFEAEAGKQLRIPYTADYYFFAPSQPTPAASRDFDIGFGY